MNSSICVLLTAAVTFCSFALAEEVKVAVDASTALSTLEKRHPRLMLKDGRLGRLKALAGRDPVLRKYIEESIRRADSFLPKPLLERKLIGPRLLFVSRKLIDRVYALGLAYRWTRDTKYADKAAENLLAVSDFKDWNPSHFLDVAEMSHGVAVGYDWLYHYLEPRTREKIKNALIKNGLAPGLDAYNKKRWWVSCEHNWNQVCNFGLIIGALAVADSEPELARQIISRAVENLPYALKTYGPDGAWPEGPGYWGYATTYTCYGLAALDCAFGKDFGLSEYPGMSETGFVPVYTTGPTRLLLNFADSGDRRVSRPTPCMFFLADIYKNQLFADCEHVLLKNHSASPEYVIWYTAASSNRPYPKQLDRYFRGPVEVATFRSSWTDPNAVFVGVKAGYNQVNHGHLDLGNFELDALGVRWARDLGSDNYNLPGYWERKKGGKRWSYYRLRSASHNVCLINGKDQDEFAEATFTKFQSRRSSGFAVVDLTSAYADFAEKATRGVAVVQGRKAVLIQDEFELKGPCEITWAMTTDAHINPKQAGVAELSLGDRKLIAKVLSPADATFTAESAEQQPPQKPNTGVKRLIMKLANAKGNVTIAVLLSPVQRDGKFTETPDIRALSQW